MACLFCDIAAGKINAAIVYADDNVTAFRDINPQAPTHILIIPNRHIESIADLTESDRDVLGQLVDVANHLARREGIDQTGYRLLTNRGPDAGQSVAHLHLHLLGGHRFAWPPG